MTFVTRAIDAGVNFFDNAWEYHDGDSESRLGIALQGKRDAILLMSKVCTHGRGKDVAMRQLEDSLRRLKTDHLDVWQIHEVVYYNDPDLIFAPGGAAEALAQAKKQGKVRFVGFTGHKDPAIHLRMLRHGFPFDTVQMPLNCFDGSFHSFEQQVLPEAQKQGVAVLGMKSLGGSGEMVTSGVITPEEGLRYAMSLPVATTISGMESINVLEQNLAVARDFQPMPPEEMAALRDRVKFFASDGRYEKFKTTKFYDGDLGREQHGYPDAQGTTSMIHRRDFIRAATAATLIGALGERLIRASAPQSGPGGIPRRKLGHTNESVSMMGIGGFHLDQGGISESEAIKVVRTALDSGVNFLDNSWDYKRRRKRKAHGQSLARRLSRQGVSHDEARRPHCSGRHATVA